MSGEAGRARTDRAGAEADPLDAVEAVEKVMALSESEFWSGAEALRRSQNLPAITSRALPVTFSLAQGVAEVMFEPLAERRLGGLLLLPQARVTLTFLASTAQSRADFLARFWMVFQRGGG